MTTLAHILAIRDVLGDVARRLPDQFRMFEIEHAHQVKALFDSFSAEKSSAFAAPQRSDILLYGLIIASNRMAAPWQLLRLATFAAETDETAKIAATPYAVAVKIVLSDLEYAVSELRSELKVGRPVAALLKTLHDGARGMRTEMDLSADSPWSRHLASIRSAVANMLTAEIETTPGRVRRLLRPRPAKEIVAGSLLDAIDVQEVETRIELHCRVPALWGRTRGQRSDAAYLFRDHAISGNRHQNSAGCVASCRRGRAAIPPLAARRRGSLLPIGIQS